MYAVGDAYKVHTECIQAYKRVKERILLLLLLIYCLFFYLYCPCLQAIKKLFSLLVPSGMYRYHRTVRIVHQASLPVFFNRDQPQFTTNHLTRELYALYASKTHLCTLCKHTTPKKTAYNAYRNANRRVRRAEGL